MAEDRRALLRRQLLKEQLMREQEAVQATPAVTSEQLKQAELKDIEAEKLAQEADLSKTLEALGAGAAQGVTFGFSDELGAAVEAAGETLTGKSKLDALSNRWRELQKQREARNKAIQEESPIAYTVGELGAGIGSAIAMPGIGAGRIAATGGKLAGPALEAFLAGKSATTAGRIGGKAVTGLIEGAPIGAAYGLGSSEANISRPAELAADIGSGAAMGSLTGLALSGASKATGEVIDSLKKSATDSDTLRHLGEAFKLGKEGKSLGSSAVETELRGLSTKYADELVQDILKVDQAVGKQVGQALKNAQEQGVMVDVGPELKSVSMDIWNTLFVDSPTLQKLLDPKSKKILQLISQQEEVTLNPIEAKALRDELYNLSNKLAGYGSDAANFAKSKGYELARALDTQIKTQIPEYAQAAKQFETFRRTIPETIMSKGVPDKYGKVFYGDLKNPELQLFEKSKEVISKGKLSGVEAGRERYTLDLLKRNLEELKKVNPELEKQLGKTTADVSKGLEEKADKLAMVYKAYGSEPSVDPDLIKASGNVVSKIVSGSKLPGYGLANKAGITYQRVFQAPNDKLLSLAQRLKSDPKRAFMGETLEKALQNKSDVPKNAVLFKLMQDPDYRNMLREEGLVEDEQG